MDNFVKTLIEEVKSQGVFDEFRFNCCLADVDTKPAYQNVRNRVETAVNDFLAKQHWTPDTNKVQLRERLRKHLLDSDVLDKGVDHIVDQVVNPKVATIFEPKIESIAYKYLGITPPPPPTNPPPRPPLLPAPPLPPYAAHALGHMNGGGNMLKVETTASLLPTDLEQISPDSDRATFKSDLRDDSKDDELPPGVDDIDDMDYDETTSPAFEPAASIKEEINNGSLNTSDSIKDVKELANDSRDAGASQASQLSQVSSDSRLTIASTDAPQPTSTNNSVELTSNIAANMSEEAQMPKFNENSSETNENSGRQLHFDIKQDAITFEGTERRNSLSENTNGGNTHAILIEDAIMCEMKANVDDVKSVTKEPTPDPIPDQLTIRAEQQSENTFSLFSDSTANSQNPKDSLTATPQESELPEVPEIKEDLTKPDEAKATEPEVASTTLPIPLEELKLAELTTSPASASSSSQTKKHSHSRDKDKRHHSQSHSDEKQRRKSRERERERDREHDKSRGKTSSSSKHSSQSSSSKHRSSSSKYEKSSTSTTSSRSNHESSTSKRSTSRHESSTHKKHKSSSSSSRSDRDRTKSRETRESHSHHSRSHNGSSSTLSTSKRSDRDRERDRNKSSSNSTSNSASNSINPPASAVIQDDHNEVKAKLQKRHSNDSNDEGKPPGASGKSPPESTESQTKETRTDSSAQNGKPTETNGTNGTNDNHTPSNNDSVDEIVDAGNVIIVSDILQQSTVSFIELSSAIAPLVSAEDMNKPEEKETHSKPALQVVESAETEPPTTSTEPVVEPEIKSATEPKSDVANEPTVEPVIPDPDPEIPAKIECAQEISTESNTPDNSFVEPSVDTNLEETAIAADIAPNLEPINESSSVKSIPSQPNNESGETFTHFEENAEEFNARLQLIEHNIKDLRMLLNVFSEAEDTSFPRRNSAKRRLSSEASSSKEHSSSSFSSSSSVSPNAKVKRTRRDDAKTSPTPSEISVNSKENEELEKHDKGDLSSRRLSQKLCQQQRYTNDDLYKPRPLLSQRSRRRGLDSIL
ncbi:biorientation of chromosomes in cell division protein 1-like 1 [Drosophila innubila]|uniref:biorientation of chromosomes in cell division protein 1-like 1 n=1 Tax=Drosophila innubila TaxID=198719 RepID=UPI00148C8627|nr:biorientation of chromosomes in cell division protein 1-like 1 [Drosophila innubila]